MHSQLSDTQWTDVSSPRDADQSEATSQSNLDHQHLTSSASQGAILKS